jgi:parvulin-like peptidyl-prolyl isomerase
MTSEYRGGVVLRSRAVSTRTAKTTTTLLVAIVATFGLAACGGGGGGGDKTLGPADAVAIQVGAEKITNGQIENRATLLATAPGTDGQPVAAPATDSKEFKEFRLTAAEQLRDERVFKILAAQCGKDCKATKAEIDTQIKDIKTQQFRGDEAAFKEALTGRGITEADLRQSLTASLEEQNLTQREQDKVTYSDAEGLAYYSKNIAQYKLVAEKRVSHILVATKAEADAIKAEATLENFSELSRTKSIDPAAKNADGDDLGPVTGGGLLPELSSAALQLKPGQMSKPIESQFGWHVLLLRDIKARTKIYDEVKADIKAQELQVKQAAAVQKWRDTVVKKLQDTAKYLNAKVAPAPSATPTTSTTTTSGGTTVTAPTATVTQTITTPPATTTGPATP